MGRVKIPDILGKTKSLRTPKSTLKSILVALSLSITLLGWGGEARAQSGFDVNGSPENLEVYLLNARSEIQSVSSKLLELGANRRTLFLGLGKSPTPFVVYLQQTAQASALTLPLSRFRYGQGWDEPALHPEAERLLFGYFDQVLSESQLKDFDQVVLFDFTISGESLLAAQNYLKRYLSRRHPDISLQAASINHYDDIADGPFKPQHGNAHMIYLDYDSPLSNQLFASFYDQFAAYSGDAFFEQGVSGYEPNHEGFLQLKLKMAELFNTVQVPPRAPGNICYDFLFSSQETAPAAPTPGN